MRKPVEKDLKGPLCMVPDSRPRTRPLGLRDKYSTGYIPPILLNDVLEVCSPSVDSNEIRMDIEQEQNVRAIASRPTEVDAEDLQLARPPKPRGGMGGAMDGGNGMGGGMSGRDGISRWMGWGWGWAWGIWAMGVRLRDDHDPRSIFRVDYKIMRSMISTIQTNRSSENTAENTFNR